MPIVVTVFLEGLLSFLSPCVLPMVPVYLAYLSSWGTAEKGEEKGEYTQRGKRMLASLLFVLGVSLSFFLLGLAATAVGQLLAGSQQVFERVGGVLVVGLGAFQLIAGLSASPKLNRELRLPLKLNTLSGSMLFPFVLGVSLSFSWTPCVGPALASVLVMAASSASQLGGLLLIAAYTVGFALPFMALAAVADALLPLLRKYTGIVRATALAGAIVLMLVGALMVAGLMGTFSARIAALGSTTAGYTSASSQSEDSSPTADTSQSAANLAPDFLLNDFSGNAHSLKQYRGKVVILNFWTSWCGYCQQEMPEFQRFYEKRGSNGANIVLLGVTNPSSSEHPWQADTASIEELRKLCEEGGYSYPMLIDPDGAIFSIYNVSSLPTTVVIASDGTVSAYVPGALNFDSLNGLVAQAMKTAQSR